MKRVTFMPIDYTGTIQESGTIQPALYGDLHCTILQIIGRFVVGSPHPPPSKKRQPEVCTALFCDR